MGRRFSGLKIVVNSKSHHHRDRGEEPGGASATGSIVMKLEGAHSYTETVSSIAGTGSVSLGRFSYPWPCPPPGTISQTQNPPNHRITVDTTNAVPESNENNNWKDFYMPPNASFTPQ